MFAKPYAESYEVLNQKKPYRKEIEFLWNWARRPKRILDIGCGTAHYWKYYPTGVKIFGVEKSQDMIDASQYKRRIIHRDITDVNPFWQKFDLVTALFDVINYVGRNDWWKELPIDDGGYFIFDIWDKDKVNREGFRTTVREESGLKRTITPVNQTSQKVTLKIDLENGELLSTEVHEMYLYDFGDIKEFAGNYFDIIEIRQTRGWQAWYKLKRK